MAVSMIGPKIYCWDRNGKPLAFGKLYTYQARTNIPKPTYQSEDQVVENANPVILNGEGYANVYLDGAYKMVLKDSKENEIWTSDPVTSNQASEWVNCLPASYLSPTSFKVNGNFTASYETGRRVRVDNGSETYAYSTIQSSSFAGGETTVVIFDPVVTTSIESVCISVVGRQSAPVYDYISVEKMKSDISIFESQVVKTSAFYDDESGGSAEYLAVSSSDYGGTPDGHRDHQCANGLVLVLLNPANTKQYGVSTSEARDSTNALLSAAKEKASIEHNSECFASGPIEMMTDYSLSGRGRITKKGSANYTASDGSIYNPLFVFKENQTRIKLAQIKMNDGDADPVTKVSTAEAVLFEFTFINELERLDISGFNWAFRPSNKDFFMTTFRQLNVNSCENAFNFSNTKFKTTLVFDRCWTQNCGATYWLRNAQYSSFISCAADWCNVKDASNPYDGVGRGSKNSSRAIYDINNCRAISMNGCGTESSYANGVILYNASELVVDGIRMFDLKSEHIPNYALFPDFHVGPIGSGSEAGQANGVRISGLSLDGWTNNSADSDKQAVICNNHSNASYGKPDKIICEADISDSYSVGTATKAVGGQGDDDNVRLAFTLSSRIDQPNRTQFDPVILNAVSTGAKIVIPYASQDSQNKRTLLRVSAVNNNFNDTTPRATIADIEVRSLTTVAATLLGAGINVASVSVSGLNVEINLTAAYPDSCVVYIEALSSRGGLNDIDIDNVSLE